MRRNSLDKIIIMKTVIERFLEKVMPEPNSGCWIWTGSTNGCGYGKFGIKYKLFGAHRFSFEYYKFPVPDGLYVCHSCDNRLCVNPDHLFVGTHKMNMNDMAKKGRAAHPKGELQSRSKLINNNIIEIRNLLKSGLTQTEIAKKFHVHPSHISRINSKEVWSHIA